MATIATGPLENVRLLETQELQAQQQETLADSRTHSSPKLTRRIPSRN